MPKQWTWREYFEEAVDENGRIYTFSFLDTTRFVKKLARGDIQLLEHNPDDRISTVSDRSEQLLADRCIQRGSNQVRSSDGGEDGKLWVLSNRADKSDSVLMINWTCRP